MYDSNLLFRSENIFDDNKYLVTHHQYRFICIGKRIRTCWKLAPSFRPVCTEYCQRAGAGPLSEAACGMKSERQRRTEIQTRNLTRTLRATRVAARYGTGVWKPPITVCTAPCVSGKVRIYCGCFVPYRLSVDLFCHTVSRWIRVIGISSVQSVVIKKFHDLLIIRRTIIWYKMLSVVHNLRRIRFAWSLL